MSALVACSLQQLQDAVACCVQSVGEDGGREGGKGEGGKRPSRDGVKERKGNGGLKVSGGRGGGERAERMGGGGRGRNVGGMEERDGVEEGEKEGGGRERGGVEEGEKEGGGRASAEEGQRRGVVVRRKEGGQEWLTFVARHEEQCVLPPPASVQVSPYLLLPLHSSQYGLLLQVWS